MVDAARGELIGYVRFRHWKWCSTNTGSNPVLTTKKYRNGKLHRSYFR